MNVINGQTIKRMIYGGKVRLALCEKELNALNVFPVPDGDTGSNMLKTVEMGWQRISVNESNSACEIMTEFAEGAVLGARGNSGVILSQIFRGIASGFAAKEELSTTDLSVACDLGIKMAYRAVMKPVEGTILTVFRDAASIDTSVSVEEWLTNHVKCASASLQRTPELLPTLKEAGVVDSGGAGYLRFTEGMLEALTGDEVAFAATEAISSLVEEGQPNSFTSTDFSAFTCDSVLEFGYCTEFFLRLQSIKADVKNFDDGALKSYLDRMGDSLVYVRMGDLIKIHVHTKSPGQVLNECQKYGEFLSLKIENMSLQHEETLTKQSRGEQRPKKHVSTVAVAMSLGMKTLFEEAGADAVILGGATTNPSTGEFIDAFHGLNADNIVVLPNNSNAVMAAQAAAKEYAAKSPDVKVYVLESKTMQAGYAALLVAADLEDAELVLSDMQTAIDEAECLSLTDSVRDTVFSGIEIGQGDSIGFIGKDLRACAKTREECLKELFLQVKDVEEKEIVTVMYGMQATDENRERVRELVEEFCPEAELLEYECGQEIYHVLITLE